MQEVHLQVLWHLAIFLAVQCEQRLLVVEKVHPLRPCSRPTQQVSTCTSLRAGPDSPVR